MYKYCVTEESALRQRQLEQCLLELMLTTEYGQITISDISDRAGISRKSFYRYFSSKEGCLHALVDHAVFDGASFYLPNHNDDRSSRVSYQRFFLYWKEQHLLLDALLRSGMTSLLYERMLDYVTKEDQDYRIFFRDHAGDAHERIMFYIGGIMTMVLDWHQNGYSHSVLQMAQTLSELIL